MMKIGILATGITPDELLGEFGSYADMLMRLLEPTGARFEFETYDVRDGLFPASAAVCDAWLITGSKCNVYQNLPWMLRLQELIREIYAAGKPTVGICFGHQIVAEALGGKVEAYQGGWGVGLHRYQLVGEHWFVGEGADGFTLNAMHQDQVVIKPGAAQVVAESAFCRYAALAYDDRILTFQAHPEFSIPFEEALIEARKGAVIPEVTANPGLASLREAGAATESPMVAGWIASFLSDARERGKGGCGDADQSRVVDVRAS